MSAPPENGSYHDEEDFTDSADEWELPAHDENGAAAADEESGGGASSNKVPEHLAGLERELRGDKVPITFHLPAGETIQADFYMGQTIEYLKVYLEQQRPGELVYDRTSLYLGEKMLIDPLSLNDLPFQAGENNDVRVVTQ